ncbi:MAG: cell wall-binding repeat-containing protein, partial [Clostridia bacterium]|nr:cell wall-binding repeat-containing protein [Clostridia bacterium]
GKGFDARVKAYTVYTTAANVLVQGLTRRTVSGVTFGTPEDGYQVFVNGSEQPAGGSISIPANAGAPAVVMVTTPNGESETIQLTVIQQEAVTLELTKESAAVSTSLVSETGSVLYPESQTAQRAVFRVLPGTYTWVGTVSSYYHTRGTVTCGDSGSSAAVATPVVEQLVTTLDAGMRASLTYQEADGKRFSWQEHEYSYLVPDSATTFNLYFSGSATTFVRGSYVNTDGALAEESSKTPSSGATSNLAASKFITSGAGNNEVIFRAERTVGNVCYYQEYFLATTRVPVLNNLAAAADTGHLVKADLKQQGEPTKGFDPLVNAYTVTVPQGAAALELTATYSAINDPGDGFYSLSVGGEAVARPQSAGSKVLRAPLDPEVDQETITFTVDTGMPENVQNQYVIVVIKSPPARVSFALTPADANLFILDNNTGEIINREADGSYELITGGSYTYTATAFGYIGEENADYMPLQAETITIALEKAPISADLDPGLQADWPRFRFDAENNGVIDYPTPVQAEQATLYWAAKVGEGYGSSATGCPILVGDYIYTYAGKSLIRIDRYTGEVDREHVGQMKTNSSFAINSPTYAQGMIFVALANGYVQAFNAETMESVWLYQAPHKGQPNCPIAYHDGYIYTGFWNSEVQGADFVCLSVTDEDPERTDERKCASWIIYDKGFYWAGAYVGPGSYPGHTYIVVGTEDGTIEGGSGAGDLLSLDRHTGRVIDRYAGICDSDIRSSIVFNEEDGKYYFTSKGGWFCSIRLKQDGTFDRSSLRKLYLAASNIYTGNRKPMSTSTPCIYNGRAYIGVSGNEMFGPYSGHNITVIDLASFRIAYTVPTQGYPQTSGLTTTAYDAGDGTVYVYFIDNYTPGKLRVIKDRPGQTAPDQLVLDDGTHQAAYTLFTPYAQQAQFAICSPIADRDGNLFFKNDSAYMMMVGPTMTKLTVTRPPRKTVYDIGESFDPAGMVVTATYANGVTRDVTKYVTCREEAFSAAEAGSVTLDLILDLGANMCLYQDRNGKAGQEYTLPSTFVNVEVAHTWQKPVWKWTGYTKAQATFTCAVDQTHQKTVSAKITEKIKEATVEADGEHTYTATVTGPDGKVYTDRKREVIPRIPPDTITLTKKNVTVKNAVYNGAAQRPVVVKDGDKTLEEGTDYTATYKKNKNVGTATVTVTGKGDYTGSITKTFKITPASVKKAKVSGLTAKTYTGAAIKPAPVVKLTLNGKVVTLKACTDYTVTYKNNTKVGTATVTITGQGNFKDALSKTFKIAPASIKKASIGAVKDQIYDAQAKQPTPAVKLSLNGKTVTLKSGTDYTVRYKNNTAPGTATITFTGKGNFTGTVSKTFKIVKENATYERIFGDNRYETSFKIADALKKQLGVSKFNCAVVADGRNYPDALAASYLASVKKAPILMTAEGRFAETTSYIRKNVTPGSTIYVIGGTGSVPEAFTAGLTGYQVKRLGGANRYGTNLLILQEARVSDQEILVVTGADFGDALSASATGKPVLLVGGSHLTAEQQSYLATLKGRKYTIVGGTEVVAAEIQADLARYGAVSRLGGTTVYDRSVNIAKKYFPGYQKHITLASGESFPDGLAGGVLAMAKGGPLLLSNGSPAVYAKAISYAKAANTTQATICGGGANEQMVTDQAVKAILAIK